MNVQLWKSQFGDDYTDRNPENLNARLAMWNTILPRDCDSILEVGANIGANLRAISQVSVAQLFACEPNDKARAILSGIADATTDDTADALSFADNSKDLVFTCGVLIHIPPDLLEKSMREIYRVSRRWIICGEYFSPSEEMVPYRGHDAAMWRRDYGGLYMDLFPDLRCTQNLFAWKRLTGLDNMTFWVLEKQ